jgi:hypothetical protein
VLQVTQQQAPEPICDTATKDWVEPALTPTPSPTVLAATSTPASLPASGGNADSTGTNPMWVWALVGVVAAAAPIATGVLMRRRR